MLAEATKPQTDTSRDALRAVASAERAVAAAAENDTALDRASAKRADLAEAAAEAAPAAIAAATTETERDLIRQIFAGIPKVLSLSQAHSEADASDDDTVDEKWKAWEAARKEVEDLACDVVDLAPETAAHALRRVMLYRQVLAFTEGAPLSAGNDDVFAEDLQVMGDGAIAALAALARQTTPDPGPWARAKAAYEAAVIEGEEANQLARAADDALQAAMPIPAVLQLGPGRWYFREEHIERDVSEPHPGNRRLTIEEAAEKLAVLREFKPRYDAESARLRVEELEKAYDAALGRQGKLAEALINTPAPTTEAALHKLQVLLFEWHGIDEPDGVSEVLTGPDPDQWCALRVMQDLMRLTGSASPLATVEPFDADAFIAAFEERPGCVMTAHGPRWQEPQAWPGLLESLEFNARFTVTDPERLTLYCDEKGYAGDERDLIMKGGVFTVDAIALMFPDQPEKVEGLRQLAAEQSAIRKANPAGSHDWGSLKDWQKDAVRAAAKRRDRVAKTGVGQ